MANSITSLTQEIRAFAMIVLQGYKGGEPTSAEYAAWDVCLNIEGHGFEKCIDKACKIIAAALLNEHVDNLLSDDDGETYYSAAQATKRVDCTCEWPMIIKREPDGVEPISSADEERLSDGTDERYQRSY